MLLFFFLFAAALGADVFSDQRDQIERYWLGEIRRAAGAAANQPSLLAERLGTVTPSPRLDARALVAVWPDARIEEIRLEVEPGHFAHALILTPPRPARAAMIALGPADRTAEEWAGLTGKAEPAEWLAAMLERGYTVCLPIGVQRTKDHPLSESTRGKERRHILHRLGFPAGRSVTGLEVTEVRGLAAWLNVPVGLYGHDDGAWIATHAAAVDRRFASLDVIRLPEPGSELWREPVDRAVFDHLRAGLPKPMLPPARIGAPGAPLRVGEKLLPVEIEERRNRHFDSLIAYLHGRIERAGDERRRLHRLAATPPQAAVPRLLASLRDVMGEPPKPAAALNARVTEIGRTSRFTAHEARIEVLPDLEVYGHLLVPHRIAGRAPAVVTQHGLGGKPKDLTLQGPEPNAAYHGYAARLADHGYVVFAPYVTVPIPQVELINPLVRMAWSTGRMRTSVELAKLRRVVDFLQSLPYVDGSRLGYYGLSYGGYSAVWMGPLEPRFKATVVSGHFNDWTSKITNERERTSYLQHPDEDFTDWNVLPRLTHVELLASFWPRAVMVEFAQHDGTTYPAWHERAWAEVETIARAWNATDRMVRDRFSGIHEIHGIGAFDFLDRWLRPEQPSSRLFPDWGEVEHTVDANPLTWVRGEFRVGTASPRFRGLRFRARPAAPGAGLTVRFGTGPGGAGLGVVAARFDGGWAEAPAPARLLDPARTYWFELRSDARGAVVSGPRPPGGSRFAGEFGVAYRPAE